MAEFYPSEVARLVLGYLKEIGCLLAWQAFLEECIDLQEHYRLFKEGKFCTTDISGKSLLHILREYCALKGGVVNNDEQNKGSNSASKSENFKTPNKVNQKAYNKYKINQKLQTQSVASLIYAQGRSPSDSCNQFRSPTSRPAHMIPRRRLECQANPLNFGSEAECNTSKAHNAKDSESANIDCHSDVLLHSCPNLKNKSSICRENISHSDSAISARSRLQDRFIQMNCSPSIRSHPGDNHQTVQTEQPTPSSDISSNLDQNTVPPVEVDTASDSGIDINSKKHYGSEESSQNSLTDVTNSPLHERLNLHTLEKGSTEVHSPILNSSVIFRSSEITAGDGNITLTTVESSVTPQYLTDPPPYFRAPNTNSPRIMLSYDRSQISSLTTPIKEKRFVTEEFCSPKRKGFIPRRRLLSESPGPKQVQYLDTTPPFTNVHEDLALLEELLNYQPLAEKIAENINKVKLNEETKELDGSNSASSQPQKEISGSADIIKCVLARTEADPVFDEYISMFLNNRDYADGNLSHDTTCMKPESLINNVSENSQVNIIENNLVSSSETNEMNTNISENEYILPDKNSNEMHEVEMNVTDGNFQNTEIQSNDEIIDVVTVDDDTNNLNESDTNKVIESDKNSAEPEIYNLPGNSNLEANVNLPGDSNKLTNNSVIHKSINLSSDAVQQNINVPVDNAYVTNFINSDIRSTGVPIENACVEISVNSDIKNTNVPVENSVNYDIRNTNVPVKNACVTNSVNSHTENTNVSVENACVTNSVNSDTGHANVPVENECVSNPVNSDIRNTNLSVENACVTNSVTSDTGIITVPVENACVSNSVNSDVRNTNDVLASSLLIADVLGCDELIDKVDSINQQPSSSSVTSGFITAPNIQTHTNTIPQDTVTQISSLESSAQLATNQTSCVTTTVNMSGGNPVIELPFPSVPTLLLPNPSYPLQNYYIINSGVGGNEFLFPVRVASNESIVSSPVIISPSKVGGGIKQSSDMIGGDSGNIGNFVTVSPKTGDQISYKYSPLRSSTSAFKVTSCKEKKNSGDQISYKYSPLRSSTSTFKVTSCKKKKTKRTCAKRKKIENNSPKVKVKRSSALPSTRKSKKPQPRKKLVDLYASLSSKEMKEKIVEDISDTNIPVLSIPEYSPSDHSNQQSAFEIFSKITNKYEAQSPALKSLLSSAKILSNEGGRLNSTHVRCLDFDSIASQKNLKDNELKAGDKTELKSGDKTDFHKRRSLRTKHRKEEGSQISYSDEFHCTALKKQNKKLPNDMPSFKSKKKIARPKKNESAISVYSNMTKEVLNSMENALQCPQNIQSKLYSTSEVTQLDSLDDVSGTPCKHENSANDLCSNNAGTEFSDIYKVNNYFPTSELSNSSTSSKETENVECASDSNKNSSDKNCVSVIEGKNMSAVKSDEITSVTKNSLKVCNSPHKKKIVTNLDSLKITECVVVLENSINYLINNSSGKDRVCETFKNSLNKVTEIMNVKQSENTCKVNQSDLLPSDISPKTFDKKESNEKKCALNQNSKTSYAVDTSPLNKVTENENLFDKNQSKNLDESHKGIQDICPGTVSDDIIPNMKYSEQLNKKSINEEKNESSENSVLDSANKKAAVVNNDESNLQHSIDVSKSVDVQDHSSFSSQEKNNVINSKSIPPQCEISSSKQKATRNILVKHSQPTEKVNTINQVETSVKNAELNSVSNEQVLLLDKSKSSSATNLGNNHKKLIPFKKRIRPVPVINNEVYPPFSSLSSESSENLKKKASSLKSNFETGERDCISLPAILKSSVDTSNKISLSKSDNSLPANTNMLTQSKQSSSEFNSPMKQLAPFKSPSSKSISQHFVCDYKTKNPNFSGKPKAMMEFYRNAFPDKNNSLPVSPLSFSNSSCTIESFSAKRQLLRDESLSTEESKSLSKTECSKTETDRKGDNNNAKSYINSDDSKYFEECSLQVSNENFNWQKIKNKEMQCPVDNSVCNNGNEVEFSSSIGARKRKISESFFSETCSTVVDCSDLEIATPEKDDDWYPIKSPEITKKKQKLGSNSSSETSLANSPEKPSNLKPDLQDVQNQTATFLNSDVTDVSNSHLKSVQNVFLHNEHNANKKSVHDAHIKVATVKASNPASKLGSKNLHKTLVKNISCQEKIPHNNATSKSAELSSNKVCKNINNASSIAESSLSIKIPKLNSSPKTSPKKRGNIESNLETSHTNLLEKPSNVRYRKTLHRRRMLERAFSSSEAQKSQTSINQNSSYFNSDTANASKAHLKSAQNVFLHDEHNVNTKYVDKSHVKVTNAKASNPASELGSKNLIKTPIKNISCQEKFSNENACSKNAELECSKLCKNINISSDVESPLFKRKKVQKLNSSPETSPTNSPNKSSYIRNNSQGGKNQNSSFFNSNIRGVTDYVETQSVSAHGKHNVNKKFERETNIKNVTGNISDLSSKMCSTNFEKTSVKNISCQGKGPTKNAELHSSKLCKNINNVSPIGVSPLFKKIQKLNSIPETSLANSVDKSSNEKTNSQGAQKQNSSFMSLNTNGISFYQEVPINVSSPNKCNGNKKLEHEMHFKNVTENVSDLSSKMCSKKFEKTPVKSISHPGTFSHNYVCSKNDELHSSNLFKNNDVSSVAMSSLFKKKTTQELNYGSETAPENSQVKNSVNPNLQCIQDSLPSIKKGKPHLQIMQDASCEKLLNLNQSVQEAFIRNITENSSVLESGACSKSLQKSPVKSYSKPKPIQKSALCKKTELNPHIPPGVKLPMWNSSKLNNYSFAIGQLSSNDKKLKKDGVGGKKQRRSRPTIKIAPLTSPGKKTVKKKLLKKSSKIVEQKKAIHKNNNKNSEDNKKSNSALINENCAKQNSEETSYKSTSKLCIKEEKLLAAKNVYYECYESTVKLPKCPLKTYSKLVASTHSIVGQPSSINMDVCESTRDIVESDIGRSNEEGSELANAIAFITTNFTAAEDSISHQHAGLHKEMHMPEGSSLNISSSSEMPSNSGKAKTPSKLIPNSKAFEQLMNDVHRIGIEKVLDMLANKD